MKKTKEHQYQFILGRKPSKFGLMSSQVWQDDPKRLCFLLSRYKFVAKMLRGKINVLEVGCADGFGSRVVKQEVKKLTAVDFDPIFISSAININERKWPINFKTHDMLAGPVIARPKFDAAYCCDVVEHILPQKERVFLRNLSGSLSDDGVLIVGTPSLESQKYASPPSKKGHVNCKTAAGLRELLSQEFENIFIFSMNDEVVHTGFAPLAHYLFAIGTNKRKRFRS